MNIRELRRPPELPEPYFEIWESLEARVSGLPIIGRPHNVASLHALLALEILAHDLRPMGEREIHERRKRGLPTSMTMFAHAMHGIHRGLQILLRAIDVARVPDELPIKVDGTLQHEAVTSLKACNGLIEMFTLMEDVAIGWRGFEVRDKVVQARSRSPERLARGIALGTQAEAEANASYLAQSVGAPDSVVLHQVLKAMAETAEPHASLEPNDAILDLAEIGTRRAGELLTQWPVPDEVIVTKRFTVGEYRRVGENVKALAGAIQIFDDYREPRDEPRLVAKTRDDWVDFVAKRGGIDRTKASAILDFMIHASSDVRDSGHVSPPTAHTPFLDLRDERLVLAPTLPIWQDPQLALRTIWKTRSPEDYSTQISDLNHRLSRESSELFRAKGWPAVYRREVPGAGDIDAGTGTANLFICGECKVFIDDPVRGADDPSVWRELERDVTALQDPQVVRRVLDVEHLEPRKIVGLVIVPGRAQSPVDFGEDYALIGLLDLRDRIAESANPEELWISIKAHETRSPVETVRVTERFGDWTIESEGVRRSDLL